MKTETIYEITIGADPELFVGIDDTLVSAHGMVEGTKEKPFPVDGGAVQVDGMALEFNINPAKTEDEFYVNIQTVLGGLRRLVPNSVEFKIQPVANFGAEYIAQQPEEAVELGCEPDFNAYTNDVNPTPNAQADFRTAAGHVHIGIDRELTEVQRLQLVILCDLFLGLPSLELDTDTKRRELYGRAGCFRAKPYGIEYRTLSNYWLASEEMTREVYDGAVFAANNIDNFVEIFSYIKDKTGVHYTEIEGIINRSDRDLAMQVMFATAEWCMGEA